VRRSGLDQGDTGPISDKPAIIEKKGRSTRTERRSSGKRAALRQ